MSSTITFSITGVSATTTWPTTEAHDGDDDAPAVDAQERAEPLAATRPAAARGRAPAGRWPPATRGSTSSAATSSLGLPGGLESVAQRGEATQRSGAVARIDEAEVVLHPLDERPLGAGPGRSRRRASAPARRRGGRRRSRSAAPSRGRRARRAARTASTWTAWRAAASRPARAGDVPIIVRMRYCASVMSVSVRSNPRASEATVTTAPARSSMFGSLPNSSDPERNQ